MSYHREMKFHLVCLALLGCGGADVAIPDGSSPDGTMMTTDTGTGTDSSTNDGGMGMDADMMMDGSANDSGIPLDSGICGLMPVDGGLGCNTLVTTGQAIKPNCHGGGPPTAVGGSIADGHYVLTGVDYYNFNTTCPQETEKIDWVICGNQWETVQAVGNNTSHFNVTALVQSPKLTLTVTCPPNVNPSNWSFDVKMNTLIFYLPGPNNSTRATTYTKM